MFGASSSAAEKPRRFAPRRTRARARRIDRRRPHDHPRRARRDARARARGVRYPAVSPTTPRVLSHGSQEREVPAPLPAPSRPSATPRPLSDPPSQFRASPPGDDSCAAPDVDANPIRPRRHPRQPLRLPRHRPTPARPTPPAPHAPSTRPATSFRRPVPLRLKHPTPRTPRRSAPALPRRQPRVLVPSRAAHPGRTRVEPSRGFGRRCARGVCFRTPSPRGYPRVPRASRARGAHVRGDDGKCRRRRPRGSSAPGSKPDAGTPNRALDPRAERTTYRVRVPNVTAPGAGARTETFARKISRRRSRNFSRGRITRRAGMIRT